MPVPSPQDVSWMRDGMVPVITYTFQNGRPMAHVFYMRAGEVEQLSTDDRGIFMTFLEARNKVPTKDQKENFKQYLQNVEVLNFISENDDVDTTTFSHEQSDAFTELNCPIQAVWWRSLSNVNRVIFIDAKMAIKKLKVKESEKAKVKKVERSDDNFMSWSDAKKFAEEIYAFKVHFDYEGHDADTFVFSRRGYNRFIKRCIYEHHKSVIKDLYWEGPEVDRQLAYERDPRWNKEKKKLETSFQKPEASKQPSSTSS